MLASHSLEAAVLRIDCAVCTEQKKEAAKKQKEAEDAQKALEQPVEDSSDEDEGIPGEEEHDDYDGTADVCPFLSILHALQPCSCRI